MANYFFTDENGQKYGPITEERLQTLVERGIITATTPLETDDGHHGLAGQIPGLKFNTASPPFAQPEQTTYYSPPRQATAYSQSEESTGQLIVSWFFDFAFRDLRLPFINIWICRILYVIYFIAAILWGLTMSVLALPLIVEANVFIFLFVILLTWVSVVLLVFFARLFCEWYIIVFDWIVETTKAARIYAENNEKD